MTRSSNAMSRALLTTTAVLAVASACTPFSNVRSAQVRPGPSLALQASVSTLPGEVAGWFWSFDCESKCNSPVFGTNAGFAYGWPTTSGDRGFEVGAGVNGVYPYVDGYVQLSGGRVPFGLGAQAGLPVTSWREHQLYARFDVPLGARRRLLLNPAGFLHEGESPNGENPGTFKGFVQGIGLLLEGQRVSWTPAVTVVAGRAERTSYGQRFGPESSILVVGSLGVTFHRRR
jgi:hypothetical protein